jgi:tetratricopeptide (TPR) repeat protein
MRFGVILLAVLMAAGTAWAADEARVLRTSAEQLAAQNRCDEAMSRARRARELAPGDARAALVEGRCALVLNEYERAIEPLESAQRLDPTIKGLHADLATAYFQVNRKRDAGRALDAAEQESPDDARVALYRGLLLLEEAEHEAAAAEFERAAALDSDLGPLAGYFAGRAWQEDENRERAQAALEQVKAQAPGSTYAEQAELALTRLDEPYLPHRWAKFQAGMDFDSNVVLLGDNVALPQSISDESDGRGHWAADFGWEFVRSPKWSMGIVPAYSGDAHLELSRFNLHYPNISGWIDRRLDEESVLRLRPHVGFATRSGDAYVTTGGGELAYLRTFGKAGDGRLFTDVTGNDYHFNTSSKPVSKFYSCISGNVLNCSTEQLEPLDARVARARDRDGVNISAGYEHRIQLGPDTQLDSDLRAGFLGGHYASRGEEYEHDEVKVWLGARKTLFANFTLDVMGSFAYKPFKHKSTFLALDNLVGATCPLSPAPCTLSPGNDRQENLWNVRVLLERPINDYMTGTVRWHYQNNDSNTDAYNYDRHIVGGYITLYYGD